MVSGRVFVGIVYVKITLSQLFDKYMTFSQVGHTLTAMLQAVHM